MTFRQSAAPSTRQNRVAEVIRECIARQIAEGELFDIESLSSQVSVSYVKVSPDLSIATVFIITAQGQENSALSLLNDKGIIAIFRKAISDQLFLKHCPKLRFALDKSWEYQRDIEEIFKRNRHD
ncbi:MAG: 30S ribosome-binding factor RbfA [Proteobacteria bacterium]|nr:30S ribosome-binding factor RbfA [Pseudomonadota bacterium]